MNEKIIALPDGGHKCDECRAAGYDTPAEFGYVIDTHHGPVLSETVVNWAVCADCLDMRREAAEADADADA